MKIKICIFQDFLIILAERNKQSAKFLSDNDKLLLLTNIKVKKNLGIKPVKKTDQGRDTRKQPNSATSTASGKSPAKRSLNPDHVKKHGYLAKLQ